MGRKRIGRNEPCPCGSGKKYKKCCLGAERDDQCTQPSSLGGGGIRLANNSLQQWSTERSYFTALAAEALALGRDLPGAAPHPWTRARIRDWFAQFDHPAAQLPAITLSKMRQETTVALFERLARQGVELDETSFRLEATGRHGRSAWVLAAELLDAAIERIPIDFALAVCELWRRLLPDRPSLEMLDELMQEAYDVLDKQNPREAVERWLSFTEQLVEALGESVRDLATAEAKFPGIQSITNWLMDAELHLHNASLSDPELVRRGIAWCEALSTRFPDDAATRSLRSEQVELHLMAGEPHAALAVAEALRALDPYDAAGYVAVSNVYSWSKSGELHDRDRAASILEEALRMPVRNAADFDLEYRLEDLRRTAG